jgi:short-subunit dehydrogenase
MYVTKKKWSEDMFDYQGKTALITGASSGIGATFARAVAE